MYVCVCKIFIFHMYICQTFFSRECTHTHTHTHTHIYITKPLYAGRMQHKVNFKVEFKSKFRGLLLNFKVSLINYLPNRIIL